MSKKQAVLSLSGGLDSSTLLLHLLANDYQVTALSFDYGQRHSWELQQAQSLVDYLNKNGLEVKYKVIKLEGLSSLLDSTLIEGSEEDVPEGHYEKDTMVKTVVPNRNKIFSSLIQSVALSIANKSKSEVSICLGVHSGDHAVYPDCRQEFRDADDYAFKIGNWNSDKVNFYTPYIEGNKFTILQDGLQACKKLGLDFDEVYKRTNTSYKPIKHYYRPETNAFKWYSDYKSSSSIERLEAFIKLGRPDPVEYADETGPVSYEVAKEHAIKVLEEYSTVL